MTTKKTAALSISEAQLEWNARAVAILESPEGLANAALSRELAFRNTMPADAAIAILRHAPAAPEKNGQNAYVALMERFGPVGLPAGQSTTIGEDAKEARRAEIRRNVPRTAA